MSDAFEQTAFSGLPLTHAFVVDAHGHLSENPNVPMPDTSLRTLLGSCIAITIWHPGRRIGGMCHFLLPSRARRPGDALDGRYGDEAMEAMMDLLKLTQTKPSEYAAGLAAVAPSGK